MLFCSSFNVNRWFLEHLSESKKAAHISYNTVDLDVVEWENRNVDFFQTQPEWLNSYPMYILLRLSWKTVVFQ